VFTAANTELSVKSAELVCVMKAFGHVENKRTPKPGAWGPPGSATKLVQGETRGWDEPRCPHGKTHSRAWCSTRRRVHAEHASLGLL